MPSSLHDFLFDVNFGFGNESIFAPIESGPGTAPPTLENTLLLSDGNNLVLSDATESFPS